MPHGYCYLWDPHIVWLHVISDALIALSYFCIPFVLVYLVKKRRDLPFNWVFWMFGAFIVGCGTTHLMEIWTIWHPSYLISGVIKAATAAISVVTAVMLIPLIPKALALPSSDQLRSLNRALEAEIAEKQQTVCHLIEYQCAVEELQLAQAALRQNQDRLDAIIQSAMDAIITIDDRHRVLIFNAAAEKMFGCTAAEATGKAVEQFIPQRFRPAHASHIRHFGETGTTSRNMGTLGAIWGVRADGEEFPLEASISQVDSDGKKLFTVILRDITERKRAEETRERLAAVIDSTDDAIISKTLDGTISTWNRGAEKVFGYCGEEVIGKPMLILFPPDRVKEEAEILARIGRGESVEHYETVRIRKDGSRIDVSVTISPVRDINGRIIGASKITRDISESKRAEEALRESEQRFQAMANGIPQLAWMAEADGHIFWYNQRWYDYTGTTFAQMEGWGWQSVHDPEILPSVIERWKGSIARGEPFDMEFPLRGGDGSFRTFLTRIMPVRDAEGHVTRWFGTNTDISEQKESERQRAEQAQELARQAEELSNSRQALETQTVMLQSVLDSISEGLVVADRDGKFLVWNPAAAKIIGMGAANVAPQEWASHYGLYMPDTVTPLPPEQTPLFRAIRGEACSAEMFLHNPELDRGVWIDVSAGPLRDENGSIRGGVAAIRDITQKKADEQEILTLNRELEHRVMERTAQLEAANKELEAFSYSVSHDLRAPLRHIIGFSELLAEEFGPEIPPAARRHLDRIQAGTRKMGLLVDELLNLARVGRYTLKRQTIVLNPVVEEVIAILAPEFEGRQVEWIIAKLPAVGCDPVLVKQIFQNLLANALKFTRPRAQAVIEVGLKRGDPGAPVFMVRDNGIGFNMKYVDKLFGVFQRLHSDSFEGTGIGLATVQRIVQKHGGRVWAEGELDKGATFYFTLSGDGRAEPKYKDVPVGEYA